MVRDKRRRELAQQGSSLQPDIVGCTSSEKEVYFGDLEDTHASKQEVAVDVLRLRIFVKDALDHWYRCLVKAPPLITFRTKAEQLCFSSQPSEEMLSSIVGSPVRFK